LNFGKKQINSQLSVGPNPVAALGTSDQHSLLQLFKEGPRQRLIGFLTADEKNSPLVGKPAFSSPQFEYLTQRTFSELNQLASESTEESLKRADVPTYRFHLSDLSPFTLGAFILFQETACALAGELYGVDAFNQPGVEETKIILKNKLTQRSV
jgi:glucose-6-phosphate isomerase